MHHAHANYYDEDAIKLVNIYIIIDIIVLFVCDAFKYPLNAFEPWHEIFNNLKF